MRNVALERTMLINELVKLNAAAGGERITAEQLRDLNKTDLDTLQGTIDNLKAAKKAYNTLK